MTDATFPQKINPFVEVSYLRLTMRPTLDADPIRIADGTNVETSAGGSGSTRLYLCELPEWLDANPGVMVCSIRIDLGRIARK